MTTILVKSQSSVRILTNFIQVHRDRVQVLTRNFDTILEPDVEQVSLSRNCLESSLATHADVIIGGGNCDSRRSSVDRDVDVTFHLATCILSITANSSSNNVVSVVGKSRDSSNSRTSSSGNSLTRDIVNQTSTSPSVFDVIVDETIEVSIQDNNLAVANFHLVSIHLQVGTVGVDVEGLDRGTSTIGSRHRVSTSSLSGELIAFSTIAPSVGVFSISINSSSVDGSRSTVADDVVTRERELRSIVDSHLSSRQRSQINRNRNFFCLGLFLSIRIN